MYMLLSETSHRVQLTVSDTGIGIPAAELPRLFERFHRVEGASGRSYEGSGIGLALVSDLVGLHCGELRVESEPGSGTAFTIGLPLGYSHLPAEQIHEATDAVAQGSRAASFVEEALRWIPGQDPGEAAEVLRDVAPGADAGPAGLELRPDQEGVLRLHQAQAHIRRVGKARVGLHAQQDGGGPSSAHHLRCPVVRPVVDDNDLRRAVSRQER
jgi:hypothetical protein